VASDFLGDAHRADTIDAMNDVRASSPTPSRSRRCVLWQRSAGDPPQPLLDGLAARGISVQTTWHAPGTMLAIVREPPNVLVIVGDQDTAAEGELLAAVRCYHPHVLRWRYTAASGGLVRIDAPDNGRNGCRDDGISEQELAMLVGPAPARVG
jgi:hypothetical protein